MEYADTGIVIQTICPMYVATPMSKEYKLESTSLIHMSPEKFVTEAIKTVGVVTETAGCMFHQIQVF